MKLILFDIDGTLIYHVGLKTGKFVRPVGYHFVHAIKEVYGVDTVFDLHDHNGSVDRKIVWDMVKTKGIPRAEFELKFSSIIPIIHESMKTASIESSPTPLYDCPIGARELVQILHKEGKNHLGIITGNVEQVGWWKLEYVHLREFFDFGVFGDEADNRIALAHTVFTKADAYFQTSFKPEDIIIVGDTIHDIRCAKAIGASSIVVTTGFHNDKEVFQKEEPNVIADSLMDKSVLDFLGVEGYKQEKA